MGCRRSSGETLSSAAGWPPINVDEYTIRVAGAPVFYRRVPLAGAPTLYLHSVPTSSDDWRELLSTTGGLAPDLPGFGRSSKAGNLDYTLPGYADFVAGFLDALDVASVALVAHGWGAAIGLAFAQRHPERVKRLAIIDAVPLLEGFQWPRMVGYWRLAGLGELVMGSTNRWLLARTLRAGSVAPQRAWPDATVDTVWEHFDQGTQRALLKLHRWADPGSLVRAGTDLGTLRQPALILWGERDPWLSPEFADAYAARLPNASVQKIPDAGHWPWREQGSIVSRHLESFALMSGSG